MMRSHAPLGSMVKLVNVIPRYHCSEINAGIKSLFSFWSCGGSAPMKYGRRLVHSFRQAPNLNWGTMYSKSVWTKNFRYYNDRETKKSYRYELIALFNTSPMSAGVDKSISAPLTKRQAQDLILRLTGEERSALLCALQEFQSEKMKAEYEGQLAGNRWRSKFGRPSKLPRLGDVDPTGSYCPVPEDWLLRKYAESVPPPTTKELWRVTLHNALPFIGFGFLDNFFMILFGDTIEMTMGTMMVISTMAAAALGNTISDVLGIGSAWYVERMAARVGVRPPALTPIQLDMSSSRVATNLVFQIVSMLMSVYIRGLH
ncbi:uncharacterized protein [Anabrus simplex]|uniref:uncharacterized protein isoform X2 n=1 Tax=Anabrus simplex TaxID=316456 RepID=UPI0035A3A4B4